MYEKKKEKKMWVWVKIKWTPRFSKSALGISRLQD
jgi:hypothetical protein